MLSSTQRNPQITIKNPKKRVTMIKHVVGQVRTQPDPIPNIVFGIPNKIDQEGAGDVIQSWATSQPTLTSSNGATGAGVVTPSATTNMMFRHFPATNRKALQSGCLDAKSQREFALKNPVMKSLMKNSHYHQKNCQQTITSGVENSHDGDKTQQPNHNTPCAESEHIFGIRSIANDVPIQDLLKCVHGDIDESDYPDRSHMQKKGRLPPAKSTVSSRLLETSIHNHYNNGPSEEKAKAEKNCFKMKRFLKVESTIKAMLQQ